MDGSSGLWWAYSHVWWLVIDSCVIGVSGTRLSSCSSRNYACHHVKGRVARKEAGTGKHFLKPLLALNFLLSNQPKKVTRPSPASTKINDMGRLDIDGDQCNPYIIFHSYNNYSQHSYMQNMLSSNAGSQKSHSVISSGLESSIS